MEEDGREGGGGEAMDTSTGGGGNGSEDQPRKYNFETLGVIEFFKRKGWAYNRTSNKTITCAVGGTNCVMDILMILDKKALRIIIRNIAPSRNVERLREICEGLNDINSSMILGCFARDIDDGDITYRVAMPLVDATLTFEQLDHCMHIAVATVDYHYPRIMKLIWSNIDAKEVVRAKPKACSHALPDLPPATVRRLAEANPELMEQITEALGELDE